METYEINGYTLEYDDETHTYIVDGILVPSVTQLLDLKFKDKYAGVDRYTLERAAKRGTAVHKAIENFCKTKKQDGTREVHNFSFLKDFYHFKVFENETPIIITKDETPIAAGRLDLVIDIDNETAIADIKTTSTLDKEYLTYQLNLYRIGYMQSYGIEITQLYGIHLRSITRKMVNIPINEGIAWRLIEDYERG